jgi:hypothetical protein
VEVVKHWQQKPEKAILGFFRKKFSPRMGRFSNFYGREWVKKDLLGKMPFGLNLWLFFML